MPPLMHGVQSNDSNYFLARSFEEEQRKRDALKWWRKFQERRQQQEQHLKVRWVCGLKQRGNTLFVKLYS